VTEQEFVKLFNGTIIKEEYMSFNLEGYQAEKPEESGFEAFKYEGPVRVNYARVIQSEKISEYYNTGIGANICEIELEVTEGAFARRKLWKRTNLDTQVVDKNDKLPVQKLADQLVALDLKFSNLDELQDCCEKLVTITPIIKAWGAQMKKDEPKVQMFNFKGVHDGVAWSEPSGTASSF